MTRVTHSSGDFWLRRDEFGEWRWYHFGSATFMAIEKPDDDLDAHHSWSGVESSHVKSGEGRSDDDLELRILCGEESEDSFDDSRDSDRDYPNVFEEVDADSDDRASSWWLEEDDSSVEVDKAAIATSRNAYPSEDEDDADAADEEAIREGTEEPESMDDTCFCADGEEPLLKSREKTHSGTNGKGQLFVFKDDWAKRGSFHGMLPLCDWVLIPCGGQVEVSSELLPQIVVTAVDEESYWLVDPSPPETS